MKTLVSGVVWLLYVTVVFFVLKRRQKSLSDRIGGLLQILTIYSTVVLLLSKAGVFDSLKGLEGDLTASNPLQFMRGNLVAFTTIFSGLFVALDPWTSASTLRLVLTAPMLIGMLLLVFAYAVFHVLIVVPVSYFGYLVTGVPIEAILAARGSEVSITYGKSHLLIADLVRQNEFVLRHFAVGLPATVLTSGLKLWPLIFSDRSGGPMGLSRRWRQLRARFGRQTVAEAGR
jgi:hypothetical protein